MGLVPSLDLRGNRVLIFIVAYNAETTIEKVLGRIPASLTSGRRGPDHRRLVEGRDFQTACATSRRIRVQDHHPAHPGEPGLRREPKARLPLRDR